MPPRSKQAKSEWAKCDLCSCSLNTKDLTGHREICCKETPFSVCSVDLASVALHHGFIWSYTLCALTTVVDDVTEHLTVSQVDQLIYIHPATMRLCDLHIGQPVVVNRQHVLTAWPGQNLPLATVGLSSKTMSAVTMATLAACKNQKHAVLVTSFTQPRVPARDVVVMTRKAGNPNGNFGNQEFRQYVARHLDGRFLSAGSTIHLTYYGQPCELYVTMIMGGDGSCSTAPPVDETLSSDSSNSVQNKDSVNELAEEVDELHLEADDSNETVNLTTLSQPVFYMITSQTEVALDSEMESDQVSGDKHKTISLENVGGLEKQICCITEMMDLYFNDPDLFQNLSMPVPHGVLLHGPSGCGKTLLARAVAHRRCVKHVVTINASEIWSKYYGESEAKLAGYFKEATERSPSVIFIDELDALCPRRESSHNEVEKRVVACLLNHISSLDRSDSQVFVIAATSKVESIDPALRRPGRLDREIEVGVPTAKHRAEILLKLLKPLQHNIPDDIVRSVAERAHGFVGADLAAVCKEAGVAALRQLEGHGEVIVSAENLLQGLQSVQPTAMREVALEVPQVRWEDIGGQADLKHKLKQAIEWPLKHPEAFSRLGIRPPRGLLMYGPPGCSKTMIAKALARESGINFIAIKGPELFSKWVGESERAVRELFRKARAAAPAIIFFDEIDALAGERGSHGGGGSGDVSDRVLAQLLTEMDGVIALKDVTIVAATNRPDRIDKALLRPGRLDRIVYVPLPDGETRTEIFQIHFRRTPVAADVDIGELVSKTKDYSGAEVTAVCREAALCGMQEDINIERVHQRHFEQALKVVTPRITTDLLQFYENYQQSSGLHSI